MSSGFPGGFTGGMYNTNQQQQFPFRSPLSEILHDPASQIRQRKRSLAEFSATKPARFLSAAVHGRNHGDFISHEKCREEHESEVDAADMYAAAPVVVR
ncbi:hypothetical protein SASPL_114977 [Salvia splendens]|uniref:Uncharacterized protein n=1 Tax=Salvia splendens TaxID=180675 RepID=A0A8X9A2K6_SALSN|nr:hypothetical protein SASPL_114977 [Salvia splendens]